MLGADLPMAFPVKGGSAFRQTLCMPFVLYIFSLLTCLVNFANSNYDVSKASHTSMHPRLSPI